MGNDRTFKRKLKAAQELKGNKRLARGAQGRRNAWFQWLLNRTPRFTGVEEKG